jgi:16S rRNA (adenine1518-N6/adenine1519-N6)-dimethyltransferase
MLVPPKKSLGQNFLTDPHYVARIIEAAHIAPEDQIVEIGAGLGHLTRGLRPQAGRLLVIELDERLLPRLHDEFSPFPSVEIVHADALHFDFGALAGSWKVVANLPYYISTPIIRRLLARRDRFSSLVLMLQREVAERIAASPGCREYGYLSVLVQYAADPRIEFIVPAGAFTPRPKVDSAVVSLTVRDRSEQTVRDETLFLRILQAAFSQRRKTLRNALQQLGFGKDVLETVQLGSGIDLRRRAETLSVAEFCLLADHFDAWRSNR